MFSGSLYRACISKNVEPPIPLDTTPDAVNWPSVTTGDVYASTASQTITGIETDITINIFVTGGNYGAGEGFGVITSATKVGSGEPWQSGGVNYTFSANDTLSFEYYVFTGVEKTRTVTVTNASDGDTVLDTFTMTVNEAI